MLALYTFACCRW